MLNGAGHSIFHRVRATIIFHRQRREGLDGNKINIFKLYPLVLFMYLDFDQICDFWRKIFIYRVHLYIM